MISELRQRIRDQRIPCYFIAPHLDDAVFSAGSLIADVATVTDCQVITVFTEGDAPVTLSARQFLRQSGVSDPHKLFRLRRAEDEAACRLLGADVKHLGFVDALFRRQGTYWHTRLWPELSHVYPTYRWHVARGRIAPADQQLQRHMQLALRSYIDTTKPYLVFAPLGTGRHVDHMVVRQVCAQTFEHIVYWNDLPYAVSAPIDQSFMTHYDLTLESYATTDVAQAAMRAYTSQFSIVYPNSSAAAVPEQFALRKEAI